MWQTHLEGTSIQICWPVSENSTYCPEMLAWKWINIASMTTEQPLCYQYACRLLIRPICKAAVPQNHSCSCTFLDCFLYLLSLALGITLIRNDNTWIFCYSFFFSQLCSIPKTIPEPPEPINGQIYLQGWKLNFTAGSSSLNLISSTRLHFLHHGPTGTALLSDHERQLLCNHMLSFQ